VEKARASAPTAKDRRKTMKWILEIWAFLLIAIIVSGFLPHGADFARSRSITYLPVSERTNAPPAGAAFLPVTGESIPSTTGLAWVRVPVPPEVHEWSGDPVLFTGSNETIPAMGAFLETGHEVRRIGSCDFRLSSPDCDFPYLQDDFPIPLKQAGPDANVLLLAETGPAISIANEFYFFPRGYFNRVQTFLGYFIGFSGGIAFLGAAILLSQYSVTRDVPQLLGGAYLLTNVFWHAFFRGNWDALKPFDNWPLGADLCFPSLYLIRIFEMLFLQSYFALPSKQPKLARVTHALVVLYGALAVLSFIPAVSKPLWDHFAQLFLVNIFVEMAILARAARHTNVHWRPYVMFWLARVPGELLFACYRMRWIGGHWLLGYAPLFFRPVQAVTLCALLVTRMRDLSEEVGNAQVRERRNNVVRTLLRVLSHDLANTTNVILMAADSLRGCTDPAKIREQLSRIKAAASMQSEVIKNTRKAYLSRGGGELNLRPVSLAESIEASIQMMQARLERKGIRVRREFPGGDVRVIAEQTSLTNQVLANLLDNAYKFSPAGKTITIRAFPAGRAEAILEIQDEGIGMPPELVRTVFSDEQRRSRPGTENEPGTGTGLLVVRDFTAAFGARVEVTSTEGQGTRIRLRFRRPQDEVLAPKPIYAGNEATP
jgi:signal transduction histidine kinase